MRVMSLARALGITNAQHDAIIVSLSLSLSSTRCEGTWGERREEEKKKKNRPGVNGSSDHQHHC